MPNRHTIFGLLFFLFFLNSCSNEICNLSGKLDNIEDQTYLYLRGGESFEIIDSILVKDGKFSYQLNLAHPELFLLHNKRNRHEFRDRKFIWLEPAEINITGDYNFLKNTEIAGSASHQEYIQYNKLDGLKNQISEQ